MHPNNIESDIESSKQRLEQLDGLKHIKNQPHGDLFIRYFEQFNPCKIQSNYNEYTMYVDFKCPLNFQGTNRAFQRLAQKTGFIPTAWWHKDGITTIAFDKILYPDNTAFVEEDDNDYGGSS